MIELLILVLVLGLVFYALSIIPIAEPFRMFALIIAVIIAIVYLLRISPGL